MAENCNENNLAKGNSYTVRIDKAPIVSGLTTSVILPSINLGTMTAPFKPINTKMPGSKLDFGQVIITFNLDEDWKAYMEIYDWMLEMRSPTKDKWEDKLSDATVLIHNNSNIAMMEIQLIDMFPQSLDYIPLASANAEKLSLSVTFDYERFEINRLPS